MDFIVWTIIIVLILVYEFVVCPKICKRKISRYITNLGGEIINIERLTIRDYLYCVNYVLDNKTEKAIVQFNLFFEDTWR